MENDEEIPLFVSGEFQANPDITEVSTMVTLEHTSLSSMFTGCESLTTINGIDKWVTNNVTRMDMMFAGCGSLTELDLSNFVTSNVTDMSKMFSNCINLQVLDIRNFDMTNTNITSNMFLKCNNLHELRLDNCDNDTINKLITSYGFPTGTVDGVTRKIYCKEENAANLTPPTNWIFEFIE